MLTSAITSVANVALVASATVVAVALLRYFVRKMPKTNGNLGFRIQYFLYTKTKLGYHYYRHELEKARTKNGKDGHSQVKAFTASGLTIIPIAMSTDNYGYLITDEKEGVSLLVDPADPDAVQMTLDTKKTVPPIAILTTHKHWDHSAGNNEWKRRLPSIKIYGGKRDNVPGVTHPVSDGDRLEFGRLQVTVYDTPGHTLGHVVYLLDGSRYGAPSCLFSGDHLFIGGIGKLFEGTASMMLHSLDRLTNLPDDTLVWPGHEYSLANFQFNVSLEPDNLVMQEKLTHFRELRKTNQSTIPSELGQEKLSNPFLRTSDIRLHTALNMTSTGLVGDELREQVLLRCRTRKDGFKAPPE